MLQTIHELPLLATIAIGLSFAFVLGLIALKLRLSPIVGYLLAGIAIGPATPGYVANMHMAEELSEMGIVLLMFGVGLHFSLRDLGRVARISVPGALAQIISATLLGAAFVLLLGWSLKSGLMLGLALSVASTVVLLRALEEHDLLDSETGRIAVGWLIIEDLATVLALILIPALAEGTDAVGMAKAVGIAMGKFVVFALILAVAGRRFAPWLLMVVEKSGSRELFTLAVFSAAVGVAFAAAVIFGLSFALGAFFAGMVFGESRLSKAVAKRALPFQDVFAVLFFVGVGMLFDPRVIVDSPWILLGVTAIVIVGKSVAAALIMLVFRYPLRSALVIAVSLAQIGEFSFILTSLAIDHKLLPEDARNLILGAAILSISLNPILFKLAAGFKQQADNRDEMVPLR